MIAIGGTGIMEGVEYEVVEHDGAVMQCTFCDLFKSCNLCFLSVEIFGHCHAGLRGDKKFVFFKDINSAEERID